jgi:dephospho-CoA kinase
MIGVGKTTLAEAISDRLHHAGVRHGLIDLDWLGQVYPPPKPHDHFSLGLGVRNLAAIVPNFVAAGAQRLVIAGTVTSRAELEEIRGALPGFDVVVFGVVAPEEQIAARIRRRDTGALRDDFLRRSAALATTIADARIDDQVVTNDDGALDHAVAGVLSLVDWI